MTDSKNKLPPPIYIVSGGQGLAGDTLVQSLLVQFPECRIITNIVPKVLTEDDVVKLVQMAVDDNGIIVHTMVNKLMRMSLIRHCLKNNIPQFDLMGELSDYLTRVIGRDPIGEPGLYSKMHKEYFDRISAIEFTLATDDGLNYNKINSADIILTGISRTGKTPLSIYIAMFGWKVANIPLVPNIDPPEELFKVDNRRVFGLSINVEQVIAQRKIRMVHMGTTENRDYTDIEKVENELEYAEKIFRKGQFSIIDVTNKPIESTANEILNYIHQRFYPNRRHNFNFK
jgi:[pyruvate, water dikinase]-phosphate phosphotransferase / [pyruvate, water dikinase] kinase